MRYIRLTTVISVLKNVHFSGKGCQSLHIINVTRIRKMLISCIKLDHALYLINYVVPFSQSMLS